MYLSMFPNVNGHNIAFAIVIMTGAIVYFFFPYKIKSDSYPPISSRAVIYCTLVLTVQACILGNYKGSCLALVAGLAIIIIERLRRITKHEI